MRQILVLQGCHLIIIAELAKLMQRLRKSPSFTEWQELQDNSHSCHHASTFYIVSRHFATKFLFVLQQPAYIKGVYFQLAFSFRYLAQASTTWWTAPCRFQSSENGAICLNCTSFAPPGVVIIEDMIGSMRQWKRERKQNQKLARTMIQS